MSKLAAKCKECKLEHICDSKRPSIQTLIADRDVDVLFLVGDSIPRGYTGNILAYLNEQKDKEYYKDQAISQCSYYEVLRDTIDKLKANDLSVTLLFMSDFEDGRFEGPLHLAAQDDLAVTEFNMGEVKVSDLKPCFSDLNAKIATINPKLILFSGNTAFLGKFHDKHAITKVQNRLLRYNVEDTKDHDSGDIYVLPMEFIGDFKNKHKYKSGINQKLTRGIDSVIRFFELKLYEKSHIKMITDNMMIPKNLKTLKYIVNRIQKHRIDDNVSIDIETTGLETFEEDARILSIQMSWYEKDANNKPILKTAAIPWDHRESPFKGDPRKHNILEPVMHNPDIKFIAHNAKFEYKWLCLLEDFQDFHIYFDTMMGEYLLCERLSGNYNLKYTVASRMVEYANYEKDLWGEISAYMTKPKACDKIFLKGRECKFEHKCLTRFPPKCKDKKKPIEQAIKDWVKNPKFEEVPYKTLMVYGGMDAAVTLLLYKKQIKELNKDISKFKKLPDLWPRRASLASLYKNIFEYGLEAIARMENRGIKIDLDYVAKLQKTLTKELNKYEPLIVKTLELKSSDDINKKEGLEALEHYLQNYGITVEYGATGALTLNKNSKISYKQQAEELGHKNVVELLEAYNFTAKYKKGLEMIESHIFKGMGADKRVHASFHLNGTQTGRLSSSNPNLQNVPKKILDYNFKKCFIPDDGYIIVDADYQAAEVRVLAWYSMDPKLIELIKDGIDMHCYVVSQVTGIPYEEVFRGAKIDHVPELVKLRQDTKAVIFGMMYGSTPYGCKMTINSNAGYEATTIDEVEKIFSSFFSTFPQVKAYMDRVSRYALRHKVVPTMLGRVRRFDHIYIGGSRRTIYKAKRDIEKQAMNTPTQATSSDLVFMQLTEISQNIGRELGGEVLLTVHDSIVSQVPENTPRDKIRSFFQYWMTDRVKEKFPDFPVDFAHNVEVGRSYGELTEL